MAFSKLETVESHPRETILVLGPTGSGKSYTIVQLTKVVAAYSPSAKIYALETQRRFPDQARAHNGILSVVEYQLCTDMRSLIQGYEDAALLAKPGDWITVDCISEAWDWGQDIVTQAVMGMSKADWIEQRAQELAKKDGKAPPPSSPPGTKTDLFWQYVKTLVVTEFTLPLFTGNLANVLVTANPKRPQPAEREAQATDPKRITWEPGFPLPDGEPLLASRASTIVYLTYEGSQHRARVLKDYLYRQARDAGQWPVDNLYLGLAKVRGIEIGRVGGSSAA